ncbi:MAG: hypothetical protein GY854_29150 [Deltaproteobacteria bacterium]|nr:hypothetical protein [Deltaproteobacteria bacterium]
MSSIPHVTPANFIIMTFFVLLIGCAANSRAAGDETDSGTGADSDADSDGDSDTDTDADAGCDPGERICVGDDVHEKNCDDGTTTFIEACEDPRYCYEGACYFDDECGNAEAAGSNIGCEYWAVDVDNAEGTAIVQPYAVAVGNVGDKTVHVKVEARIEAGGYEIVTEQDIPAKEVGVFKLTGEGVTLTPALQSIAGSYHQPRMAYRVTSDLPVIAYQFNPYSGLTEENSMICSNDATLLIPTSGIDKVYYALTYPSNNGSPAYISIVATEDDTTVTVTPAADVFNGWDLPAMATGTPSEIYMEAADVAQLESEGDLSGTYIEADKPIVVFAGNVTAFVPNTNVWYADHLEHQMMPLTKWGTDYIAARSKIRSTWGANEKDFFRIIASEDGTVVETDPVLPNFPATLNAGEVVQVGRATSFTIKASEPIMVGQFIVGADATGLPDTNKRTGDPSYALLAPVEQFLEEYVFLAPDKYPVDYVVITHPTELDIELDDVPLNTHDNCVIEELNSDWNVTRCAIGDFTHTISADKPVGITVWGYGENVSYGYTGGLSLQTINPVVK